MPEGYKVPVPALTRPNRRDLRHLLFLSRQGEGLTTEHPIRVTVGL